VRRRNLPQELKRRPRPPRGPLALAWALGAGASLAQPGLPTLAPATAPPVLVQRALPAEARSVIALDLRPQGESYLGFSELRTTATLSALSLLDPTGRSVWRLSAAEAGRRPAVPLKQPELGDAYALPSVPRPGAGIWQLVLERAPGAAKPAEVLFSYRVEPRFSLALWAEPERPAVGQPQLLTLRAFDMGAVLVQVPPLSVQVLDAQDHPLLETPARPRLPTPTGAVAPGEPGVAFAQWQPTQPGRHRLQVRWQAQAGQPVLSLVREVEVAVAEAELHFRGARPELGEHCLQGLSLQYDVRLSRPPAGLTQVLNLQLRGPLASQMIGVPLHVEGSSGTAQTRLPLATLRRLGLPLRIESARLLRFGPSIEVLAEGGAVDLVVGPALCP
jgi:hypothetical protein